MVSFPPSVGGIVSVVHGSGPSVVVGTVVLGSGPSVVVGTVVLGSGPSVVVGSPMEVVMEVVEAFVVGSSVEVKNS